jgi:hypothetical protein
MKVEVRAEAALFPEKEYINGIAVAVYPKPRHAGSEGGGRCVISLHTASDDKT